MKSAVGSDAALDCERNVALGGNAALLVNDALGSDAAHSVFVEEAKGSDAAQPGEFDFFSGSLYNLVDLKKTSLNGSLVMVVDFPRKSGRVAVKNVQCDGSLSDAFLIKPMNLSSTARCPKCRAEVTSSCCYGCSFGWKSFSEVDGGGNGGDEDGVDDLGVSSEADGHRAVSAATLSPSTSSVQIGQCQGKHILG